jgi:hypothetical protein
MTEEVWLATGDARALLSYLWPEKKTLRKLRLFACAVCRRSGAGMDNERGRRAVELAEHFADGLVWKREMSAARAAARGLPRVVGDDQAWRAAARAVARSSSLIEAAGLLRDIFGNPFRPVLLDRCWLAWQNGTIVKLAQAAYEVRVLSSGLLDNDRLAILADALEDAGCTDAEMLAHCREPAEHVRGCWLLDLLLAKY